MLKMHKGKREIIAGIELTNQRLSEDSAWKRIGRIKNILAEYEANEIKEKYWKLKYAK